MYSVAYKLVDGPEGRQGYEGRVQLHLSVFGKDGSPNNRSPEGFGTVCSEGFDNNAAAVVCRSLRQKYEF